MDYNQRKSREIVLRCPISLHSN